MFSYPRSLNGNPIQCDCHLAIVMRNFEESNRLSVFTSSGAICDASSNRFPGAVAAEVLRLIFCPREYRTHKYSCSDMRKLTLDFITAMKAFTILAQRD